ncbi:arginase family protein [Modestobacter italicus]|uniref:arginase family protein n=1 Tax=Modestobacter italicus (strain DSM 44449 / CECT 9708 / BC 501) TaxID=2732864 RepID=UPI001C9771B7|nr:arginase family protein [Modestobacter italicus]
MFLLSVPFHLDERLHPFELGVPADAQVTADLPPGSPWTRMAVLYEQVAAAVGDGPAVVASGDCTTSLGVLAGLQRAGRDVGVVWFDAHADFHTDATTTSGYLGGMPLALAVGRGDLTLPRALGLRPVPESRVVLVDARDTDPGEQLLLAGSAVTRSTVADLPGVVPDGDLYVHLDVDVVDPAGLPDLLYPAPGGVTVDEVLAAVRALVDTGRVAAVGLAATWHHRAAAAPAHRDLVRDLLAVLAG